MKRGKEGILLVVLSIVFSILFLSFRFSDNDPSKSLYKLPYPAGREYEVTQGNFGKRSHNQETDQGRAIYAFDFRLDDGETIVASRSGRVLAVQDRFGKGKDRKGYENLVNFVLIDHQDQDGTSALYLHLQQDSVAVKEGAWVEQGEILGKADSSGRVTGAHLHFQVEKTPKNVWTAPEGYKRGWYTQSQQISFADQDVLRQEPDGIPKTGKSYRSDNAPQNPETPAQGRLLLVPGSPPPDFPSLWSMKPDGTDLQRILKDRTGYNLFHAAVSSDGTRVALPEYEGAITILTPDGRAEKRLTLPSNLRKGRYVEYLRWSPDGAAIVFEGGQNGHDVYVINVDSGRLVRLTSDGDNYYPSWSPDSKTLLFAHSHETISRADWEIFLADADGRGQPRLIYSSTGSRTTLTQPAWSPDGTAMVFTCYFQFREICTGKFDGNKVVELKRLAPGKQGTDPKWSPDGTRIAFVRENDGPERIIVVSADGARAIPLVPTGTTTLLSWLPWGKAPTATATRTPTTVPTSIPTSVAPAKAIALCDTPGATKASGDELQKPVDMDGDGIPEQLEIKKLDFRTGFRFTLSKLNPSTGVYEAVKEETEGYYDPSIPFPTELSIGQADLTGDGTQKAVLCTSSNVGTGRNFANTVVIFSYKQGSAITALKEGFMNGSVELADHEVMLKSEASFLAGACVEWTAKYFQWDGSRFVLAKTETGSDYKVPSCAKTVPPPKKEGDKKPDKEQESHS